MKPLKQFALRNLILSMFIFPTFMMAQTFTISNYTANACTACVQVEVQNFSDILSAQWSILWDPTILSFDEVNNFNPVVNLTSSSFYRYMPGVLNMSWFDSSFSSVTLPDGSTMFDICFDIVDMGTSLVEFSNTPVAIEVVDNTFTALTPTMNNGFVISILPCTPLSLVVNDPSIIPNYYYADLDLSSTGTVANQNTVGFFAGDVILLDIGFGVELGGSFTANIE